MEGDSNKLKGYARKFIDQWCSVAGLTPIWIDETKTLRKTNLTAFWSWQEMLDAFGDTHRVVFFDPKGDIDLTDLPPLKGEFIYCVGSDEKRGFGEVDLTQYETVRLSRVGVWHGFTIVPIVAASHMLRV